MNEIGHFTPQYAAARCLLERILPSNLDYGVKSRILLENVIVRSCFRSKRSRSRCKTGSFFVIRHRCRQHIVHRERRLRDAFRTHALHGCKAARAYSNPRIGARAAHSTGAARACDAALSPNAIRACEMQRACGGQDAAGRGRRAAGAVVGRRVARGSRPPLPSSSGE